MPLAGCTNGFSNPVRNSSATGKGMPRPGRGPGQQCPVHIETTIDEGRDNRRQPADPRNFPFLPCPRPNGGAGQGYARQWLAPVALPSLPALQRPGFRSDRSKAVLVWSRSAPCPHQQVRGGSEDLQTTDTGTSPKPGNTSPGGLPPWLAAQRMAPSVLAAGFGRQSPALPDDARIGVSATRPAALRRPL